MSGLGLYFHPGYSGPINTFWPVLYLTFLLKRFLVKMASKLTLLDPHPVPGLQTHDNVDKNISKET